MYPKSDLLNQQRSWAESSGLNVNREGYLDSVDNNLFKPLSPHARKVFEEAGGRELIDQRSRPAKMKALHSSSALAVNFFDEWSSRDAAPLLSALGVDDTKRSLHFEAQFPTGLKGTPPNLDIAIQLTSGRTVAIECKFTEWIQPKPANSIGFNSSYFPATSGLWDEQRLSRCQRLAEDIHRKGKRFDYLDAPQLLKHALGLATQLNDQFSLCYLYFDWPGSESEQHRKELFRFAEGVDEQLGFRFLTYQEVFACLQNSEGVDRRYLDYLRDRYFAVRHTG